MIFLGQRRTSVSRNLQLLNEYLPGVRPVVPLASLNVLHGDIGINRGNKAVSL